MHIVRTNAHSEKRVMLQQICKASHFLSRESHTSDPLGRYYTSQPLSRALIERIDTCEPKVVLELGSGSGALSSAAAARWRTARLITVDTDHDALLQHENQKGDSQQKRAHFIHDVLDASLSSRIGLGLGTVDVAVCNPPYIRPRWKADFGRILEDARLSGTLTSLWDAGADLLFLAQNLRLLRDDGMLGLILPDGLITAERFSGVRKALLRQHLVKQIIQLPRGVFARTEAQTYLAVLTKNAGETDQISLSQMCVDGSLSQTIELDQEAAIKRLDYSFHSAHLRTSANFHNSGRSRKKKSLSLGEALTEMVRGSICSSSIANFPTRVFHLSDFAKPSADRTVRIVPKRFALGPRTAKSIAYDARLALPGDILVARVGRSLAKQIALVVHGPCAISDCIFALRTTETHREKLYRFLDSDMGSRALAAAAHGVAARFVSKNDLFEIQF